MEELRKMNIADLQREVRSLREICAKMRLGIQLQKEKDTAKYQRQRRTIPRLLTVLGEKSHPPSPRLRRAGKSRKSRKSLKRSSPVKP
jgi:ribosomal protein L29